MEEIKNETVRGRVCAQEAEQRRKNRNKRKTATWMKNE